MEKKELVYHNDVNKLELGKLTEKQQNIFFSLLYKFKYEKNNNIKMEFSEIKKLADLGRKNETLINNLRGLNRKLQSITQEIEVEGKYIVFSVFKEFIVDTKESIVEISLSNRFYYLLDNLIGKYTIMDLKELVSLKGNYSKILYRLLKQWEKTNKMEMSIEEFRKIMGIPNTYKMFNIGQRVFTPCLEELTPLFEGLKIEKIKKGVRIDKLRFTWKDKKRAQTEKAIKGAKELFNKAIADKRTLEVEKEVQELEKQEQKPLKQNTIIQREKITSKAYESKYKEYLKVLGVEHNTFVRKSFDIINKPLYEIIEDTENKIKIKPQEIKTKYQEFLNKYDCDDNPIMKKAFDEILEKEYIIDLENL